MREPSHFEVLWAPLALDDLDRIIEFVADSSMDQARKLLALMKEKSSGLSTFPTRARLVPELKAIGLEIYRELLIDPYRMIFRIRRTRVHVLGVFDSRRDLADVLFERLGRL